MTLTNALDTVLTQTGLSISNSDYRDQARTFVNMVLSEVLVAPWWFLDATTTFALVASTRSYQPVSGQVASWYSFHDETNNRRLRIVGPDEYDDVDPDRTETGTVEWVHVAGLDSTTGYPVVDVWRVPTAVATIRVRYRRTLGPFVSSDDSTDLTVLGLPETVQNALIHGATALYMASQGNSDGDRYAARRSDALQLALTQQRQYQGARRYPPIRGRQTYPIIRVDSSPVVES